MKYKWKTKSTTSHAISLKSFTLMANQLTTTEKSLTTSADLLTKT